jgi:hypothetical protein
MELEEEAVCGWRRMGMRVKEYKSDTRYDKMML